MTVSVEVDLNRLKGIVSDLVKTSEIQATVGIKDLKNNEGSKQISTQEYANYFEFGWVQRVTGKQARYLSGVSGLNIHPGMTLMNPPRPFFRQTLQDEGADWVLMLKNAVSHYSLENIITAHHKALAMVAGVAAEQIRDALLNGGTRSTKFPRRTPLTMAIYSAKAKGHKSDGTGTTASEQPGRLSGLLAKAIDYEIG